MIRKYDGKDLARVLLYYGLIGEITSSEFNINCPFHDDPNPSMMIKLTNGTFYCFGCGLFGNAYDFVKYAQPELDNLQCCIVLEKIVRSEEVRKIDIRYKKKKSKTDLSQMLIDAEDYYYGLKKVDWTGNLTSEQKEVYEYMEKRGFDKNALNYAKCRVSANIAYPIIFPIFDNNIFRGYVCRTTNKRVEQKAKYLYNDGFRKRDTLCGQYEEKCIPILCEGFLDYLSIKTKGRIKNVVAVLGWHISDEQVNKLKQKGIKKVICALDNPEIDKAGEKGIRLLEKYFDVVPFCYPDSIKDPGEMSKKQMQDSIKQVLKVVRT